MPDAETALAHQVFLRASTLGRKKTVALIDFLTSHTGLHSTSDLARHFSVTCSTILRRLRILLRYGLVTQVKGAGRTEKRGVGGREPDFWGSVPEETIDTVAARVVGRVTE